VQSIARSESFLAVLQAFPGEKRGGFYINSSMPAVQGVSQTLAAVQKSSIESINSPDPSFFLFSITCELDILLAFS
jgi:hypothetical protein